MRRLRVRTTARALLAPEIGTLGIARTRETGLYPVEFVLRGLRNPAPATVHVYSAHGDPTGIENVLPVVPFRASRRRAIVHVPEGELQWVVRSRGMVIADGVLVVSAPAALPPSGPPVERADLSGAKASAPEIGGHGLGAVRFSFNETVDFSVREVAVEFLLPTVRVFRLSMVRPRVFGGILWLPPGMCKYRFRVVSTRPVRRDAKCSMTSLGWDFDASYDWGLASHWCEVNVPSTTPLLERQRKSSTPTPPANRSDPLDGQSGNVADSDPARSMLSFSADERLARYSAVLSWCRSAQVGNTPSSREKHTEEVAADTRSDKSDTSEPSLIILGNSCGDASTASASISIESHRGLRGFRKAMSVLSSLRSRSIRSRKRDSGENSSGGRTPASEDLTLVDFPSRAPRQAQPPNRQPVTASKRKRSRLSTDDPGHSTSKRAKFTSERRKSRTRAVLVAAGKVILAALVSAAAQHFMSRYTESRDRASRSSVDD